jgi:1-acyl-sn-glycerol-3-phosphate acyltransferase
MFRKLDAHLWDKNKFLLGAILFSWIKLTGVFSGLIFCYVALKFLLRGKNIEDISVVNDPKIRSKIESICKISSSIIMFSFGIIKSEKKVDFDYTEYLGKNYCKDNETIPATYIVNHTSWIDIILMGSITPPGFISRIDVKYYPIVGYIATCLGCIFVDRDDKQNRGSVITKVLDKQNSIISGEDTSKLLIFPEGTTSNTTGIMPFKQGAFLSSLPIKPYVIKFDPINRISLAMSVIEMLVHYFIVLCTPIHYIELISLPVFVPNEYLYNQSKYSKLDLKWKVYAETMRDIMCKASGLKAIEGSYEMKVEYLDFLRKNK